VPVLGGGVLEVIVINELKQSKEEVMKHYTNQNTKQELKH